MMLFTICILALMLIQDENEIRINEDSAFINKYSTFPKYEMQYVAQKLISHFPHTMSIKLFIYLLTISTMLRITFAVVRNSLFPANFLMSSRHYLLHLIRNALVIQRPSRRWHIWTHFNLQLQMRKPISRNWTWFLTRRNWIKPSSEESRLIVVSAY